MIETVFLSPSTVIKQKSFFPPKSQKGCNIRLTGLDIVEHLHRRSIDTQDPRLKSDVGWNCVLQTSKTEELTLYQD